MTKFRITTAWVRQDDENPWLLDAYDEWTEDSWGGEPDTFAEAIKKARTQGDEVRLVDLYVDYDVIEQRFASVSVTATTDESSA